MSVSRRLRPVFPCRAGLTSAAGAARPEATEGAGAVRPAVVPTTVATGAAAAPAAAGTLEGVGGAHGKSGTKSACHTAPVEQHLCTGDGLGGVPGLAGVLYPLPARPDSCGLWPADQVEESVSTSRMQGRRRVLATVPAAGRTKVPPKALAMVPVVMQSVMARTVMPAMAPATAQAAMSKMTPAARRAKAPAPE